MYMGDHVYANFNLVLVDDAVIEIGDNVMIGPNVVLCTGTHPVSPRLRAKEAQYNKPVKVAAVCGSVLMPWLCRESLSERTALSGREV